MFLFFSISPSEYMLFYALMQLFFYSLSRAKRKAIRLLFHLLSQGFDFDSNNTKPKLSSKLF